MGTSFMALFGLKLKQCVKEKRDGSWFGVIIVGIRLMLNFLSKIDSDLNQKFKILMTWQF